VNLKCLWRALAKITLSLLCAGVFYFVWMASFLFTANLHSGVLEAFLWLLAPVITALGFTVGIVAFERLTMTGSTRFFRLFVWPLIGCTIGAGIVYWFGPMLIVFGMFTAGTASVALKEVVQFFRCQHV
jgi:hypothetical protein